MPIEVFSAGSSSSGNSYIIKVRPGGDTQPEGQRGANIILDVGLTAKRIFGTLEEAGLCPGDVDAVLVTHEHSDHVKSIRAVARRCSGAVCVTSRGTAEHAQNFAHVPPERLRIVSAGDSFILRQRAAQDITEDDAEGRDGDKRQPAGCCDFCQDVEINDTDVVIRAFALSHDAYEPVGYTISCGDEKLAVVTDTGVITEDIYEAVRDAGMLVFESNHDEGLLMYGEYPYPLKVRIKSDRGHLSNRAAGETLARLLADRDSEGKGPVPVMLAHLSFHNNAPFLARQTVENILSENGYERDVHYTLTIAGRDETTCFGSR